MERLYWTPTVRPVKSGSNPTSPLPFTCRKCRGAGYIRQDVPWGHPLFGKPVRCDCKIAELKVKEQQKLIDLSGLVTVERFKNASFDTFTPGLSGVYAAFKQARQFAACPMGWLVLVGPYGCGKTHLAVAIAKQRVEAGDTVLFQTVPDLLDHLRSAFSPAIEQTYDARLEQLKEVDLLILDDYGAEHSTSWAVEKLFQLLNHRYNKGLPTVITSNNIHLKGVDPRIVSRLSDKDLVCMVSMENAQDYRVCGESLDEEED